MKIGVKKAIYLAIKFICKRVVFESIDKNKVRLEIFGVPVEHNFKSKETYINGTIKL